MNQIIAIVTVNAAKIANKMRTIAAIVFGKDDIRDAGECMPYGVDSSPIKNAKGLYVNTTANGTPFIIGYKNTNQKAGIGEYRTYSTDNAGAVKFNVWLRANGECLMGASENPSAYVNNLIKYAPLNTALQSYFTALSAAITAGVGSAGGTYTAPPAPNFTSAKIDEIKVI